MSDATNDSKRGTLDRLFDRPPGWIFHVVLALALLWSLFSASAPGGLLRSGVLSGLLVLGLVVAWIARLAGYLVARRGDRAEGSPWWLAVAPAMLVLTVVLTVADVPLRARFALARGDFDDRMEEVRSDEVADQRPVELAASYGTYDVTYVDQVGADQAAVRFFTSRGGFDQETGFVHVEGDVDEVDLSLASDPELVSLGGGWYAFTADR